MINKNPNTFLECEEMNILMETKGKIYLLDHPLYKHDADNYKRIALEVGSPVYIVNTKREPGCVAITVEDATGGYWTQYLSDLDEFYSLFSPLTKDRLDEYLPHINPKKYKALKRFARLADKLDTPFPSLLMGPCAICLSILAGMVAGSDAMEQIVDVIPMAIRVMSFISLAYGLFVSFVGYAAFFKFCYSDEAWYRNDELFIPELQSILEKHPLDDTESL